MSTIEERKEKTKQVLMSEVIGFLKQFKKEEDPDFERTAVNLINSVGKVTTITQGIINEMTLEMMSMSETERNEVEITMSQIMPRLRTLKLKCLFIWLLKSQEEIEDMNPDQAMKLFVDDMNFITGVVADKN